MIEQIRALISFKKYRLTFHAEDEREADKIFISEIEEAFSSGDCVIIEDYPEDKRGHSSLVLGFTKEGRPIHMVCAIHEDILVIITIYRPDPELWVNWRIRKEK
jgi:hypothetical protein